MHENTPTSARSRRRLRAVGVAGLALAAGVAGMATAPTALASPAAPAPAAAAEQELEQPVPSGGIGEAVLEGTFTLNQLSESSASAEPDHFEGALPVDPAEEYTAEQKAARAAYLASTDGDTAEPEGPSDEAGAPEQNGVPFNLGAQFWGIDQQAGGCFPPDNDGAVGRLHFVEIANCRFRVYRKSDLVMVKNLTLQQQFNDSDFVFDPRMVYDQTYKRWAGLVTRRSDSSTDTNRYLKFAVTNASNGDASQNWRVYRINFGGMDPGEWCDYPQLGMSQDAFLVTCNNFTNGGSFTRAMVFSFPKARAYNGWGFSFPLFFTNQAFSLAPPVLVGTPQQSNDDLYFLFADNGGDDVDIWRMNDAPEPEDTTFVKQFNLSVPAWSAPPDATNCGGGGGAPTTVDALDGRFQQNSWQNENSNTIWNVHTELSGDGTIVPRYYQINPETNTLVRTGVLNFQSSTDEFNAVITVNGADQVFALWNNTDNDSNPCLQIRRGGCEVSAGDCDSNIASGSITHINGAGPINNQQPGRNRYGDYATLEPDPSSYGGTCTANKSAWGNIETTRQNDGRWDSRILQFGFSADCP